MTEAYIVDVLRTPTGRRRGALAEVHPVDLGAHAIGTLVGRNSIPPEDYDDVIFGCVDSVGPQAGNIARISWLAANLPLHIPGVTIDRRCGSSQQAVHFSVQAVMSGMQDVVVAGGVQNMTQVAIGSEAIAGKALGLQGHYAGSKRWTERFGTRPVSQFAGAQMIADKWNISREQMELYALESHRRARFAQQEGRFDRELIATEGLTQDETVRDTTLEQMAKLEPLSPGGSITAGVSSQTGDAASAMLIVSERALKRYGLTPRARIHHMSVFADDPFLMLTAPIPATHRALKLSGMKLDDIALVEINEAFASVVLAWLAETGYSPEKTNVNGGAIALAHPLGATGVKLMGTLLHELERTNQRYGLQTMCEGGGMANVTIIERL